MYLYKQSEPQLWTVGIYVGEKFEPESDHDSAEEAADRVRYLNGGEPRTKFTDEDVRELMERMSKLDITNVEIKTKSVAEELAHFYTCSTCDLQKDDRHGDPGVHGPSDPDQIWTCPECIVRDELAELRATIKPVVDCVSKNAGEPGEGFLYSFSFAFGSYSPHSDKQDEFQRQLKALYRLKEKPEGGDK